MSKNYNIFYNNATGQVIMKKDSSKKDNEFDKKIEELSKFANISTNELNQQYNDNKVEEKYNSNIINESIVTNINTAESNYNSHSSNIDTINNTNSENRIISEFKKDAIYGIKKTILSDFNFSTLSSNNNDFKIGINKNSSNNTIIFDSFYLFPNISEINTKTETNIINEKKVEIFENNNDLNDKQYFPIDFIPCGINIPLKKNNHYSKIIISNIFWNIFQSIDRERYDDNELLCITPDKAEFVYKKINLEINFELHSQLSSNIVRKNNNKILPYKNERIKTINPGNSCLYKVKRFTINTLNGSFTDNIEINLNEELKLDCALLCIRISVANESYNLLKGFDKYNKMFCGHIPFSQFILNFEYNLI
jgi:hypothetical protein